MPDEETDMFQVIVVACPYGLNPFEEAYSALIQAFSMLWKKYFFSLFVLEETWLDSAVVWSNTTHHIGIFSQIWKVNKTAKGYTYFFCIVQMVWRDCWHFSLDEVQHSF